METALDPNPGPHTLPSVTGTGLRCHGSGRENETFTQEPEGSWLVLLPGHSNMCSGFLRNWSGWVTSPHPLHAAAEEMVGQGNRAGEARDTEMGQEQWDTKVLIDLGCKSSKLAQDSPAQVRE